MIKNVLNGRMNNMEHVFSKQVGQYLLQAIPSPGLYTPIGAMGMFWEGQITQDLKDSKFIDNKNLILRTQESYSSPEAALMAAEHDIPRYEEHARKMHIRFYEDAVMDIEEFKKREKKDRYIDMYFSIISIDDYNSHNFYTDDNDYIAFLVYKDKVLWYQEYDKYDAYEQADFLKDEKMTFMEFAANAFGCKVEDIKNVLFIDFPECK